MKQGVEGFASGRVQGVSYRQFTQEQAIALGIDGWVKNLPDGRVAFAACGEAAAIHTFLERLHQGPPRASVTALDWEASATGLAAGFRIIR